MSDSVKVSAVLDARDCLEVSGEGSDRKVKMQGCHALLEQVTALRAAEGPDPQKWKLPEGNSHTDILLRELILKLRGEWLLPYPHEELCHCRTVPTRIVDQAIIAGAHTPEAVSRQTSASTACGTCRPDVEKMIAYRLKKTP
jgi:bacterioferritin-associated ferredoxin